MKTFPKNLGFVIITILLFSLSGEILRGSARKDDTTSASSTGRTIRISLANDGSEGNGNSINPSISANGRYVTYSSYASNLVMEDKNGKNDIFLYDTQTQKTILVSIANDGNQGNNSSWDPDISSDGRFMVFNSWASNLVSGDTNGFIDIYLYDIQTGETARVSISSDGYESNDSSSNPSISGDGRFVTFQSLASNLVDDDTNEYCKRHPKDTHLYNCSDIFVYDTQNQKTIRVSVASDGSEGNNASSYPNISEDGRFVTFTSAANNLVEGDNNGAEDIFLHDIETGETRRLSVARDGTEGNFSSIHSSISEDGRFVAFLSYADNLVQRDTNGVHDVFLHDTQSGETTIVSLGDDGTQGNKGSGEGGLSISDDGTYIAFISKATNLVMNDSNAEDDIFLRNIELGKTILVSLDSHDDQANGHSSDPSISAGGRFVTFISLASNLVANDTNRMSDIFLRENWIFKDVPLDHWVYNFVDSIYRAGITAGCSTEPLMYCPDETVSRAQIAVFLENGIHYPDGYSPPDEEPSFGDTAGHWAEDWIEALYSDGITAGCSADPLLYCPDQGTTRAQMAVFLLKSKHGAGYSPPDVEPTFNDTAGHWAEDWIEQLAAEGITAGCGGGNYCPEQSVTRAQMAVFLVRTFNLPLP